MPPAEHPVSGDPSKTTSMLSASLRWHARDARAEGGGVFQAQNSVERDALGGHPTLEETPEAFEISRARPSEPCLTFSGSQLVGVTAAGFQGQEPA
jgi:hypothetical protein